MGTADELRRQADTFVDLADLQSVVGRPRQNHNASPKFLGAEEYDETL